jgi:uncharacterized membrane protein YccC
MSIDRVRRWLLQDQAFRTALAAALSWAVGSALPGVSRPYFAPLAAILTVQVTVAASLSRAVQRTLGVVVGVVVALALARVVGLTAWGIGLLVLVALALGARLRLGASGAPQVAVSALLVVIVGHLDGSGYAWARIVESAIGAACGVAVGVLLVPASGVPAAREALRELASDLARCLADMADGGPTGPPLDAARELTRRVEAARGAVHEAEESLRYNVWAGGAKAELDHLRAALAALEHTAIQARGIARALDDHPAAPGLPHADAVPAALRAVARLVDGFWREVVGQAAPGAWPALAEGARRALGAAVAAGPPGDWVRTGSLLGDAERLVADLGAAVRTLDPGR